MKKTLLMIAAVLALCVGSKSHASDSDRVLSVPGNALVMPFDARDGKSTFLVASNVGDQFNKLTTHWAFWSETCSHLADVSICLTRDDTVVVDPAAVSALNEQNEVVGPTINLTGTTGFVTVTAYQTDDDCTDAGRNGEVLVDDALIGSFTLANLSTNAAIGGAPLVLGLDDSGQFTNLPDQQIVEVNLNTFSPGSLEAATAYAYSLEEQAGVLQGFAGEIGPARGTVTWSAAFYDNTEQRTSLPDISWSCATSIDVLAYLDHLEGATSGVLRLTNVRLERPDGTVESLGGTTGAYGVLGEAVGPFGAAMVPSFKFTSL